MRRAEIISGVQKIRATLAKHRVIEAVERMLQEPVSSKDPTLRRALLEALRAYTLEAHALFGPTERRIAEIFKLDGLEQAETWASLFDLDESGHRTPYRLYQALHVVPEELSQIVDLMKNAATEVELNPETFQPAAGMQALTILVIENDDRASKPARLIDAIDSITLFYEAFAVLLDYQPDSLSVIGCDSGSDKSFDFLGVARGIEAIKELIVALWDRVVFYRENKVGKQLELLTQALPVIDQIGELENTQKISREQAEILRRKIIEGSEKFIRAGIVTPEIISRAKVDPRLLMAPEQKLLASGPSQQENQSGDAAGAPPSIPQKRDGKRSGRNLEQIVREVVERLDSEDDDGLPS